MTQAPSRQALEKLYNILGKKGFTTDADVMKPWLIDWRGKYHGQAAAIISPATTIEVSEIMKLCAAERVGLVPQGGNSGMVAGATPDESGHQIILSTRRMTAIRNFDAPAMQATVEAGVILQNFHDFALQHGFRFPLTLGGKGSATIGGLISTNAGGTQVLRFGNMRQMVVGLEVVLADGQILNELSPLKKDNRGYNLQHLFCGAEGTLGIITAATLQLVPQYAARNTAWIGLSDVRQCLALLRHLDSTLTSSLEGFEIISQYFLGAVLKHVPQSRNPLSRPYPCYVLIEIVGDDAATLGHQLEAALQHALEADIIIDAVLAKNEQESEAFWRLRDSISAASRAEGPAIQHDISVPVSLMPEFIEANPHRMEKKFPGVRCHSFGHLGDGNIHHHVQPPIGLDGEQWIAEFGQDASREVYRHVIELGGSLSAEHGIGQMKRDLLAELDSPARLAALRAIKTGLDPLNICNPGKLIQI